MNQEFNKIASNYESASRYSNCLTFSKQMPYRDQSAAIMRTINSPHNGLISSLAKVKQMLISESYKLLNNSIIDNQDATDSANRVHNELNVIRRLKENFTQWSVFADKAGIDYSRNLSRIEELERMNDVLILPYKRTINFIEEVRLLAPYLVKSKNTPNHETYTDMLAELKNDYRDILTDISFVDYFKTIKNDIVNYIDEFKQILDSLVDQIQEANPEILSTISSQYVQDINKVNSGVSEFLISKSFDDKIKAIIELEDNQKIQAYVVFDDESIAVKRRGEFVTINKKEDLEQSFKDLKHSIITSKLKKRPNIAKFFIQLTEDNPYFDKCILAMDTFINNEQILKNMKMDFNQFKHRSFEVIDDYMNDLINQHKLKQYANSIISNKYKHLLSDDALESFKVLKELNISEQKLQQFVGKKLASIATPEEFETYLEKVIDQFSGFSHSSISSRLEDKNIKPVYDEDNVLVFQVKTYADSKDLGSVSWCIVRNESYFDSYTIDNQKQYFLYDFNKNERENTSMIGFTLTEDGEFHTQHLKNDDYFKVNQRLQDIANRIIYENKDEFVLSEIKLKQLNEEFENSNNQKLNKHKQGL
jgi:hypothetical protein